MKTKHRAIGSGNNAKTFSRRTQENYEMPNEAILPKSTIPFPGGRLCSDMANPPRAVWWVRAGIWIGTLMPEPPPKIWSFNPTVITLCLVIVSMAVAGIGALMGAAYYVGRQDTRLEQVQQELDKVAADAKRAKDLEIYNSRQVDEQDGHAITPKTQQKEKNHASRNNAHG